MTINPESLCTKQYNRITTPQKYNLPVFHRPKHFAIITSGYFHNFYYMSVSFLNWQLEMKHQWVSREL